MPGLGTVLSNEEVTADGRSERGNFPVFRRPLTQWMMRITAYADRLLDDLDRLDWSESLKLMQRNWIGRSTGARIGFAVGGETVEVFTTRPDTLFGATYMVLAPEHPLVVVADRRRRGPTAPTPAGPGGRRRPPRRSRPTSGRPPAGRSWTGRTPAARRPASGWASPRSTRSTAASCRCSSPTTC